VSVLIEFILFRAGGLPAGCFAYDNKFSGAIKDNVLTNAAALLNKLSAPWSYFHKYFVDTGYSISHLG
jgi:hypothetical protein